MIQIDRLISEFKRIRELGYVQSHRRHNTGIGKTFEDYLGIDENNLKDPDFGGIEIKTQRQMAASKITLFTKCPSNPKGANAILKDTYGYPDRIFKDINVLHTSIFGDRFNCTQNKYGFKLKIEYEDKIVRFLVKHLSNNKIQETDIYWTFEDLQLCIDKKLNSLFVVFAEAKKINDIEHFHFTNAIIYHQFKFDKFLVLLNDGIVQFDIRIGAFKTKGRSSYGKPHDHGSGFRIHRDYIDSIYKQMHVID